MAKDRYEEAKRKPQTRKYQPKSTATADWASVSPEVLRDAVATVAASGGALRLGYTSDGGAYAIGIYGDGDPYTEYVRPNEDVDQVLRNIANAFE